MRFWSTKHWSARGVAFLDSTSTRAIGQAKVVIGGASTLESARLMLLSRSPQHPNGLGNSSGHVVTTSASTSWTGRHGLIKELVGNHTAR